MNLYQCQQYAEREGFDSVKFLANFPVGTRVCTWLDAYFGMFQIEGMDGFVMVRDIDSQFPSLDCTVLS